MARNRIRGAGAPQAHPAVSAPTKAPDPTGAAPEANAPAESPLPAPGGVIELDNIELQIPRTYSTQAAPEAPEAPVTPAEESPQAMANRARIVRRDAEADIVDRALAYFAQTTGHNLTRASLLPHLPGDGGPGYKIQRAPADAVRPELIAGRWRLVGGIGNVALAADGTPEDGGGWTERSRATAAQARINTQRQEISGVRVYTNRGTFFFRPAMERPTTDQG